MRKFTISAPILKDDEKERKDTKPYWWTMGTGSENEKGQITCLTNGRPYSHLNSGRFVLYPVQSKKG